MREKSAPPGCVPYLISDAEHRAGAVGISDAGIACTQAICNYIYQTYGRFPGSLDAMHLMWLIQVHNLDTDYYYRFVRPGVYGPTTAAHLATWHADYGFETRRGCKRPGGTCPRKFFYPVGYPNAIICRFRTAL